MTAAMSPSVLQSPSPPHPTAPAGQVSDPHRARPARREPRNAPYLAPVPDCEPPFDDEASAPRPIAARISAGIVVAPIPADVIDPNRTPMRATDAAPRFGAAPAIACEPARHRDRRPPSSSPQSAPRSEQSTPREPAAADVLLLDPVRTARPTTITAPGVPGWSSEADIGVRKTASEHLPPAERAASVLARALVEVLSGHRPLSQLRVHCAPEIYAGLGRRPLTPPMALPHLLTVRVCEPADGVAEVGVAFRRGERVKALAFRMEGVDGRWRITALQLG